jgi:16S rRNA (cytosine967-C5)-methyltransferase
LPAHDRSIQSSDFLIRIPMISPARSVSFRLLNHIESRCLYSDDALHSEDMAPLDVRDRHLTTEIVYGTLRWQATLDYVLASLSSRPWKQVSQGARNLLRMSLYQMWKMDRVPDYALVNDAVELAKHESGKGIGGYVNGILRRLTRTRPWNDSDFLRNAPMWARVSLPEWLWDRWSKRFGEEVAESFALSLNQRPQTAGRLSVPLGKVLLPFEMVPSDLVPGAYIRTGEEREGESELFQVQDEASQLIPHLLGPDLQGWRVWDACAAPGGKTAILSGLSGASGHVISSDLNWDRMLRWIQLEKKSGAPMTNRIIADARRPSPFLCRFDAVLADAPCSGLGTLRRNPEKKWHFKPEELAAIQKKQTEMLHCVSECIRVGGRLLYCTCSTEPEENEQVVESFLSTRADFAIDVPAHPPGIEKWIGQDGMVRTFPSTHLWDGFFAALLVRK